MMFLYDHDIGWWGYAGDGRRHGAVLGAGDRRHRRLDQVHIQ